MEEKNELEIIPVTIEQLPVFKSQIAEIRNTIEINIKSLKLEEIEVTEENLQEAKKLKASLNKQKQWIKDAIKKTLEPAKTPFAEIELQSKEIEKFISENIEFLASKTYEIENGRKNKKEQILRSYFNEICENEHISWLSFENVVPSILISISETKYKEQINDKIYSVIADISMINQTEYPAEILVEYKKENTDCFLNATKAITKILNRKHNEQIENERILVQRKTNRQKRLSELEFSWNQEKESYIFSDEIFVTKDEILNLNDSEWIKKIFELESNINNLKNKSNSEQSNQNIENTEISKPIENPEIIKKEELFTSKFEITDTFKRQTMLKNFLQENNFNVKNL